MTDDRSAAVSARMALERAAARARLLRRIGAIGGFAVLLGGMLVAAGQLEAVLLALAALVAAALGLLGARLVDRERALRAVLRAATAMTARGRLLGRHSAAAIRAGAPVATRAAALGSQRLLGELRRAAATTGEAAAALRRPSDSAAGPREALRLNALGIELRRSGASEQAVETHLVALEIFRRLGDRRAQALTENNIALALERAGHADEALDHFEEAIAILRDLDDPEREGQVIANLGVAHLRRGDAGAATDLLHEALDKLEPGSPARREVERQLLRTG